MTDKKENMIDNIINEQVEDADYEEEEGNDSDGRKGREARSGREKAGEAKAEEKGTSDGNKTKPKIPKKTAPTPMPLSRARRAKEGSKENKAVQEKKTEIQQQGKQETRERAKGTKGGKGGKGKGKGKGASENKEWKTFIFHQGVNTPQGAIDIKRGATQLMEIGLGVMKNMSEVKIMDENKLTVNAIVELAVIQNIDEIVKTFELKSERVSMSKLGYVYNGRGDSDVSRKRKIEEISTITIDDTNDKIKSTDEIKNREKIKQKRRMTKDKKKNAINVCKDLYSQLDKTLSTFVITENSDLPPSDKINVMIKLDRQMRLLNTMRKEQIGGSNSKHKKSKQSSSSSSSSTVSDSKSSTGSVSIPLIKKSLNVVLKPKVSSDLIDSQDRCPSLSVALTCNNNTRSVKGETNIDLLEQFTCT
jgi:hypothetical protein